MKQGEQAWLLAGPDGNHEFSRVFWTTRKGADAPGYIVRDGTPRIGAGIDLTHIAADDKGAQLTWSNGLKSFIPRDWYQLTYR